MRTRVPTPGLRALGTLTTIGLTLPLTAVLLSGTAFAGNGAASGGKSESASASAAQSTAAANSGPGNSTSNSTASRSAGNGQGTPASTAQSPAGKGGSSDGGSQSSKSAAPAASKSQDKGTASSSKDKGSASSSGSGPAVVTTSGGSKAAKGESKGDSKAAKGDSKGDSKGGGKPAPADTTKPQPLSNADKNGTGANPGSSCTHAYCSTRDGRASENGNGDGKATGRPCQGCVGKADNKNPRGQRPNGSDRNNGYECDGNKGIGKGNPAHTSCAPGTSVLPSKPKDKAAPCTVHGSGKDNGKNCPQQNPATPGTAGTPGSPGTSDTPGTAANPTGPRAPAAPAAPTAPTAPAVPAEPTVVLPIVVDRPATAPGALFAPPFTRPIGFGPAPTADTAVQGTLVTVRSTTSSMLPSALPFTGADAALLAQIAVLALLSGAGFLYFARKQEVAQH
jgi:hypothetical protein